MATILALETSCDETAIALVNCGSKINVLKEVVASQIKIHRPYGGVVPLLAKREHIKNLPLLYKKTITAADEKKISKIAVTVGPGLEPALWAGINFAHQLSNNLQAPVVGVNHLEGHIFSNWLASPKVKINFPAVCLVISGGHTILLKLESKTKWQKLGETRDDAVGEAFDKVAKMLNLPYPGGPEIEKLAQTVKDKSQLIPFPRPMANSKNYDFSFSGLKTAVLYYLKSHPAAKKSRQSAAIVAASFQQAAIDSLAAKAFRAAVELKAKSILLCGGVASNNALKNDFALKIKNSGLSRQLKLYAPPLKYNTDNAAMIAAAACWGHAYPAAKALPNLNL